MGGKRLVLLCLLLSSLCGGLAIPVFLKTAEDLLDWWQPAVVYQIYPRSFKDTDDDGMGDLRGIIEKIGYLKHLGVDAVWLSPIYPTADADFGYDIKDYINIDPRFGDMYTFLQLADGLEKAGIKLIMDFVPNHSSNQHPWFVKSKNNHPAFADYYVWSPSIPNNWVSLIVSMGTVSGFGGSAWEYDETRKAYYLHQFLKEQPDLNYAHPRLLEDMKDVLKYWTNNGVDGFRMDAVYTIWEDNYDSDEPYTCDDHANYGCLNHTYTADREGTYGVLTQFREVLDEVTKQKGTHTRIMMTESYSNDRNKILKYYGTKSKPIAHFPFNFDLITRLNKDSTASDWANVINEYLEAINGVGWPNWVLGNHDQRRVANRFGREMGDPLNMLGLVLKGTMVSYQGEELVMENSEVRWDQAQDPQGIRAGLQHFYESSRDPQRGPFIWDDTKNAGTQSKFNLNSN
ncbi:hypothetical protein AAG570_000728 [Ranatra chinensis]|uniref:alpha-glucosidase n=1 Tax=Ranatra chinensis TaxID=642074 RepID=A0ABD0YY84_9HEMI